MSTNPHDQLEAIAPHLSEATRQALIKWGGRQAIWARWHEIALYTQALEAGMLQTPDQTLAYFGGRLTMMAQEMDALTSTTSTELTLLHLDGSTELA